MMRQCRIGLILFCVSSMSSAVRADPCGMVPPVYVGRESPITRKGIQKTYVFYKGGVETFVIRPGFEGKVDEFGMLIPFPSTPAIRKVSDNIFSHIAPAIDPPEIIVDSQFRLLAIDYDEVADVGGDDDGALAIQRDTVRVLKEEAVGMYEVAVLEAGSAAALKRWMDENGYRYPKGMDRPANDYAEAGWCFVAVKTKVGQKKGVDPKPGQRQVNPKLPAGSTFDGHVQAMGFRFKVDKLVVPMRLSTFNEGELRNVVYVLTNKPQKIRSIPEEYVVRQISGEQLFKNVTEALPLRIIGGTLEDVQKLIGQAKKAALGGPRIAASRPVHNLKKHRDPVPHNGTARDLFATDLLSVKREQLSHPHEEQEKEILRIGERLGLRGPDIDKLNEKALESHREQIVKTALADLKQMTLTVIDGDFPRVALANHNLTFASYKMPSGRNKSELYDAKQNGPTSKKQGVLHRGKLFSDVRSHHEATVAGSRFRPTIGWAIILSGLLIGVVLTFRRKR